MRVFLLALIAAALLASLSAVGLHYAQETSAQAYHSSAARLDHDESVDAIGRQG